MPGLSLDAVPPAPREPSPRARELIFRYQGSQKVLLLVGAIFLAIGVLLSVPMNWGLPSDLALSVGGRPSRGRGGLQGRRAYCRRGFPGSIARGRGGGSGR